MSDGKLWAIEIETNPSFSLGNPVELFDIRRWATQLGSVYYDVTPDGQRFMFVQRDRGLGRQINVVLNWFEELKERVPVP